MKKHSIRKRKTIAFALSAVVIGIIAYTIVTYIKFNHEGLDTWLVGQTADERYPDWGKASKVQEVDCHIRNKSHLFFSKVYLLEGGDSYQLRFRIAYSIPFLRGSLFEDTDWLKLADADGNDYTGCLTAYSSRIAGLNCINATLVLDEDTFSALSGGKLSVSAVCKDKAGRSAENNSYAGCEVEILIPESDSW